jgi:hypothetical protein
VVSPVDICNMALDNIGSRLGITSLDPPLPQPNAGLCARHYQPKMDALARAAHWNCMRLQKPLSVLKAAQGTPENPNGTTIPIPPIPYQYEYAYPSDCLKARYILPNPPNMNTSPPLFGGGTSFTPAWNPPAGYPFAVAIDTDAKDNQINVILTNLQFAQLVYTGRILNPSLWDPQFQLAATAFLGAWLVNAIKRDAAVLKEQIAIASEIVTQARISDGNEGTLSVDHEPDWMRVRGITGFGRVLEQGCFAGWDALGLPGGAFL